jgi:hypothetical protein
MSYKAKNIDVDKFIEGLERYRQMQYEAEAIETAKTQKYFEGVREGLRLAENMFYCSNYEKKGGEG